VAFKPLGQVELRQILGLELNRLQQRILNSPTGVPFVFGLTEAASDHVLREGTDMRYGARHLKRAIDRSLVHPLSNLIATQQVRGGDWIRVDIDPLTEQLTFIKEAEDLPAYAMAQATEASAIIPASLATAASPPNQTVPATGRRAPVGGRERNLAA
jgi:hypothetical protein